MVLGGRDMDGRKASDVNDDGVLYTVDGYDWNAGGEEESTTRVDDGLWDT